MNKVEIMFCVRDVKRNKQKDEKVKFSELKILKKETTIQNLTGAAVSVSERWSKSEKHV